MKKLIVLAVLAAVHGVLGDAVAKINPPSGNIKAQWFEEFVPMADGAKLYTIGVAPAASGKFPIVVFRSPYVKERRVDMAQWEMERRTYTSRGYACVLQHCRGCGMSEDDWVPYESERADGLALLEFVRKLPWYNGEIFLAGSSYTASTHYSYLNTNPPDVKGAALTAQDANRYNICYRNGFFKIALTGSWFKKSYKKKNRSIRRNRSVDYRQFPLADFPVRYWGVNEPSFDSVLTHPRADDPFWSSGEPGSGADFRDAMLKSTMPVLLKTSFYDIYTDGVCAMWREMPPSRRANCSLVIDASNHSGRREAFPAGMVSDFPGGARLEANAEAVDWFDSIRSRKASTNAPPGQVRYYALWENAWRTEPELADGSRKVCLKLGEGVRRCIYDPLRDPPEFPGSGGICFGGMQIQPPPENRDDVITFVLPPLAERLDVRGRMEAELSVASDCEDSSFYIRVCVDKGDGKWLLLRDDIASLAYDAPYVPGTRRRLRYRFADHAFRLEKGDRLRVDVSGASKHFAPHPNVAGEAFRVKTPRVAHNQVFADESKLVLFAQPPPASCAAVPPEKENFHLFVLGGQSNMSGRGDLSADNRISHDRVLVMSQNGTWREAVEPFHWDKRAGKAGLAATFARAYADAHPGVTVGLIPVAYGGSPIRAWQPKARHYTNAVHYTRLAMKDGVIKGFLWHQGESDAFTTNRVRAYLPLFTNAITRLRREFGIENVPFVAGELGPYLKDWYEERRPNIYWREMNAEIAKGVELLPNAAIVSSEGLYEVKKDKIHFATPALRKFGVRYWEVFKKMEQKR